MPLVCYGMIRAGSTLQSVQSRVVRPRVVRRMKILQIHNRYREPGGEDTVVAAEAELLRSAGHEVFQFQVENPNGNFRAAGALAIAPWNPFAARRVKHVAESFRPDVAHVHNTWYSLSPSVVSALKAAGIPVVMTLHNYRLTCANGQLLRDGKPCDLCVGSNPLPGVRYRCYRDSSLASISAVASIALHRRRRTWTGSVDRFVAMTGFGKSLFAAAGLPSDRIVVKPHFVSDPGPRPSPPSTSNTVLYAGRLSGEKGIDVLIDAWEMARPRGLELVLLGDGPLRSRLAAREVDGVSILGGVTVESVRRRMHEARTLVFPSIWYETFGLVIVEALSSGTPTVVSDLGGMPELVSSLGPSWLVAPASVPGWATALAGLADDALVDSAGEAARSTYQQRYTPERGLQLLEDLYRAVGPDSARALES